MYTNYGPWGRLLYRVVDRLLTWEGDRFIFTLYGRYWETPYTGVSLFIRGSFTSDREDVVIDDLEYHNPLYPDQEATFSKEDFIDGLRRMWIQHPTFTSVVSDGGGDASDGEVALPDTFYTDIACLLVRELTSMAGGFSVSAGVLLGDAVFITVSISGSVLVSRGQKLLSITNISSTTSPNRKSNFQGRLLYDALMTEFLYRVSPWSN